VLQRLSENINDIRLYDTDSIIALTGISQYDSNVIALEEAVTGLGIMVEEKLSN
jgi:hypothetical protein